MDINLVHAMHYQNEARYMAAYNARKARCFMGLEE